MYNEELHGSAISKTRNKENGDRRSRFERSAIYRDSRRKTAAMLEKKKSEIKGENSEDEADTIVFGRKKVQFVRQTSCLRSHGKKTREKMMAIEEDKADESQVMDLNGSPYNNIIKEKYLHNQSIRDHINKSILDVYIFSNSN
uniref:IBB domain-containing protein n=1 Tax=Heterorhabditis bacteriophora TaxID=37862 RepID=A0A1I7WD51_HETBA